MYNDKDNQIIMILYLIDRNMGKKHADIWIRVIILDIHQGDAYLYMQRM